MLWAVVLVPSAAAVAVALLHRRERLLGPLAVAGVVGALGAGAWAAAAEPSAGLSWGPVLGLSLEASGLARVMVVLVPAIAAPVIAFAAASEEGPGRARLLALMAFFVGAMELLVLAADLLTLLIGWELVGACSWALIAHRWRDRENPTAAAQAFVTTRFGDLGLYLAAGALLAGTGSLSFDGLGSLEGNLAHVAAAGLLLAAAGKSAQLPFSPWLFSAMAGPTPVSALLHSATMVAAGAYVLARLAPALGAAGWLGPAIAGLGLATALAGGLVALLQGELKRALAASTSAQYGLMLVAVGAGATAAAGAHLVAHAAFKALLFLGAGVALHAAGTGDLARLRLGRALPRAATLFGVGALALAAVPPLGGAWSKEAVLAAAVHRAGWLGAGVLLAGFLSAAYAGRLHVLAFGRGSPRVAGGRPSPVELGSLGVLAGASVLLGLLWLPGARGLVEGATGGELASGAAWELAASLAIVAAGAGLVFLAERRDALFGLGLSPGVRTAAAGWLGIPALARVAVVDPVLAVSRLLARVDDRVVDAGVRAAARVGQAASRLLSLRVEWSVDGLVRAVAGGALRLAGRSRVTDERAVDGAVEGLADGVGVAGRGSRRLQTGLAHQYYLIVAVGVVVAVLVAVWR
ncbi:MAG: NADH-quinone oxidoreductase subunit L [Actinobacteria bacterium]|nr:NADH-quinone oxidoreductase subunit L [Actinomycetota bacterium]